MTNHPITPPPELVAKLWREASAGRDDAPIGEIFNHGVLLAYSAGADHELEACCEWVRPWRCEDRLRTARRPKPPSLKEQALEQLECIQTDLNKFGMGISTDTIRCALEALPE